MESSCSGDPKEAITKRRKRHRKTSNLSERLNPDFDLRDAIVQKATPKPQPLEKNTVLAVDSLVKSYPLVIHDYLKRILKFLQSDETELCFPNIAPFKHEFLVKIAQNHSLLNVVKFWDEGSLQTAKQILDVLGRNKDVFKWICMYEDGRENKNVLVYKKVNVNKSQSKQDKMPTSTAAPPSTIESGMKSLSLSESPDMPPGLKITMLNTTLKFIKDPTRLTLEYPEMSLPLAQYMHNLIWPGNKKDGDLGYGFKSMYSILHETIDKMKDKYDFHFTFKKNTSNKPTTKLVLNKIPKEIEAQSRKIIKSNRNKLNSSISSTSSTESKSLSKSQREYLSKQRIVKKLPSSFLENTLQKFLEFIDDKAQASVEFKNVNITESRFLESLITISRTEDHYCLFSSECGVMLKRVSRAIRRKDWGLTVNVGKLCRKTETRTIVFFKSPTFHSNSNTAESKLNISQKADNKADKMARAFNITPKNDNTDERYDAKLNISVKNDNTDERSDAKLNISVKNDNTDERYDVKLNISVKNGNTDEQSDAKLNISVKNGNKDERSDAKLNISVKNDHHIDRQNAKSASENDSVNNALKTASDLKITVKNDYSDRRNDGKVTSEINVPTTSKSHGNRKPIAFLRSLMLAKNNPTDHKANETCAIITQSGSNVAQNGSGVTQIESNVTQTGSNVTQTGSNVTQTGSNVTQTGSNVTQTGSNFTQIGSNQDVIRVEIPPASRKGRLLQALNTPLESNRAERMMRMMGWEGGALGLRGEGITEPILPALHIAPGAGLGHVKHQPPATLSAKEFRISFLQSLLTFLRSSASKTDITFAQPMTKRQCNFVKHTIPGFNDRTSIGLNGDEEIDLVDNIIDEMRNNLQFYIDYKISADKKTLHLVKTEGPKFPLKELLNAKKAKKEKKKKKAETKASTTAEVFVNDDNVIDISDTIKDIETICPTRKAARTLAFKITFLKKIKEFLTNENEFAEYKFNCVIKKKLQDYFKNVIRDVNSNTATTRSSEIENDLMREIRKNSNGCYMSITFSEKKFRVQKKFGNKQVNPIHNLPPPKSKDLKNTIIYQNNVAIPADKYDNEHNINDDDHQTKHDKDSIVFKDGYLMVHLLPKVNDNDLKIENNEKEVSKTDETPRDKTRNDISYESDNLAEEFDTSEEICLDISNDSLMLDVIEEDTRRTDTKNSVTDTEYEKCKHDLKEVNNNREFRVNNSSHIGKECCFEEDQKE